MKVKKNSWIPTQPGFGLRPLSPSDNVLTNHPSHCMPQTVSIYDGLVYTFVMT